PELLQPYVASGRVHHARNPTRQGLPRRWRQAFRLALEVAPEASYFACLDGTELWEPETGSLLVQALEARATAVLASPAFAAVGDAPVGDPFEVVGVADPNQRVALAYRSAPARSLVT